MISYIWRKVIRVRYILLLMVIVTIAVIFSDPDCIFKNHRPFETKTRLVNKTLTFGPINNSRYDLIMAEEAVESRIFTYSYENGYTSQRAFDNMTMSDMMGSRSKFYVDKESGNVYIILYYSDNQYSILEYDPERHEYNNHKFYEHPLYDELQKQKLTIGGITFCDFVFDASQQQNVRFLKNAEGYIGVVSLDMRNRLGHINTTAQPQSEEGYRLLAEELAAAFGRSFTISEAFKLKKFFMRKSYYEAISEKNDPIRKKSFIRARIIDRIDVNADGIRDFIIAFAGYRYLYQKIMCLDGDLSKNQILWEKDYLPDIRNDQVTSADIDNDGSPEIMLSFYSPRHEHPIDIYEKGNDIPGSTFRARFYVLDNNGEIKKIEGRDAVVISEEGFYDYRYHYSKETNKILLGLYSLYDNNPKKMLSYDLNQNKLDTLDIDYKHIVSIRKEKDKIAVFDAGTDEIRKLIFNKKFKLLKVKSLQFNSKDIKIAPQMIEIGRRSYYLVRNQNSNHLINSKFTRIYDLNLDRISLGHPIYKLHNSYFALKLYNGKSNLAAITFTPNRNLNIYLIAILLTEIILIVLYYIFYLLLKEPISSPRKNFFIIYDFAGRFFWWNVKGKLADRIDLPKRISTTLKIPQDVLLEITERPVLLYQKRLLLFKYFIYEINSQDEWEIVQRVSHNMKNRILKAQFQTDSIEEQLPLKKRKKLLDMRTTLDSISESAQTLVRYSHIEKLYLETIEISNFINDLIFDFMPHPLFDNIVFNPQVHGTFLKLDIKLFSLAFENIVNNALEEIKPDQKVEIKLSAQPEVVELLISNPLNNQDHDIDEFSQVGFSTKENGSGIGLPLAQIIIEKHEGLLECYKIDESFCVLIKLPMIKTKKDPTRYSII